MSLTNRTLYYRNQEKVNKKIISVKQIEKKSYFACVEAKQIQVDLNEPM